MAAHRGDTGREQSTRLGRWYRRWLSGRLLLPGYYVLAVALAVLPARAGTALHEAQYGIHPAAYLLVGVLVDVRDFALVFAASHLLVALALRSTVLRSRPLQQVVRVTVPVWTSLLFAATMVAAVSAAEFRIERGIYPTTFDLEVGLADTGVVAAALGVFGLSRFLWPTVAAVVAFALATYRLVGATEGSARLGRWREHGIGLAMLAVMTAACFGLHRGAPHLFRSIPHWRAVGSPLVIFVSSGAIHENIRLGAISLFKTIELDPTLRGPGARSLGFSAAAGARLAEAAEGDPCASHPLMLPLEVGAQPAGASPAPAADDDLRAALRRLSHALFDGRGVPLRLWHVVLESFRGDDIHALNERAPPEIAPVAQGLYEAATGDAPTVIAPRNHFGAGTRTSQGLSALVCGLGTMPMGLAFGRDLGLLPLRCLPDVLRDAGFATAFYYGSTPDFDNMRAFFNYHGFQRMVTKLEFQQELWSQDWDAPDWAPDRLVFRRALADSAKRPPLEPQYNLVLSLTNHFPFSLPGDAPGDLSARVRAAVEASGRDVTRDHAARLGTFAYTDFALGELVSTVEDSAAADHSLIIASADHSTPDFYVWQDWATEPPARRRLPATRIPLFVIFPRALIAAARDPSGVYAAIAEVNELLAGRPTSQNDVPLLVLELLSQLPQLSRIPDRWRWHTLGAQALSPHFSVPGHRSAALIGVDAASRLFLVDRRGSLLPVDDVVRPTFDPEEAVAMSPLLLPATAFLASFVQGYGSRCWQPSHIRQAP